MRSDYNGGMLTHFGIGNACVAKLLTLTEMLFARTSSRQPSLRRDRKYSTAPIVIGRNIYELLETQKIRISLQDIVANADLQAEDCSP